jgi:hypothetical protein
VGQPATGTKYKKQVRKFEEGTPQQWIDFLRDLQEIWAQNSIVGGTDRASTVRAVVKGERITSLETSLQEARTDEGAGVVANMASAHVDTALTSVATTVFHTELWNSETMDEQTHVQTCRIDDPSNGSGNHEIEQRLTFIPSRNRCIEIFGYRDYRTTGVVVAALVAHQVRLGRLHPDPANEG